MSKDAKLGLVLGIAAVIVIAVVFFRKDTPSAKAATESAAASVKPKSTLPMPEANGPAPTPGVRQHVVVQGESLFSIAESYYGDRTRFILIYEANRNHLQTPERLTAGTVLVIPE